MNKDILINLSLSSFLGALIWALSPAMTGQTEPWDAESVYYFAALFVAGAIAAIPGFRPVWAIYLGIFLGQLLFILFFLPSGPLLAVGLIFIAVYSLLSLVAAVIIRRLHPLSHKTKTEGNSDA